MKTLLLVIAVAALLPMHCTKKEETTTTTETSTTEAPAVVEETRSETTGEDTVTHASWNSWIQNDDHQAVSELAMGEEYDVNFDLALLDYRTVSTLAAPAAPIDRMLQKELERNPKARTLTIYAKPVVGGRGLRLRDGNELKRILVKLDLLRARPAIPTSKELPEVSAAVSAAQIPVRVIAERQGCASVGVSIWNTARNRPLDHLVRYVRVGGNVDDPSCDGPEHRSAPLKAGLLSLLSIREDQEADAALHVFEMAPGNKPESHAVFAQRGGTVLSWTFRRHLSEWVTAQSGLLFRLKKARNDENYDALATELTDMLFNGEEAGQDDATEARRILSEIAVSVPPKSFFARLVNVEGENLFLPLGLISVKGNRLLDESTTVSQPLPRESYAAGNRCIETWNMVLPQHISPVDASFLEPIAPIPGRTSTWSGFEKYLLDENSSAKGAEGLVLLTHQAEGRLWFDPDSGESIMSDRIKRKFPPGSVAVVSACSVGDIANESGRAMLTALNEQGVDALVLSPFGLQPPVGARFAFHFANEVLDAKRKHQTPSLAELFRNAVSSTRADKKLKDWQEGVHEFVLTGNGGIRVCK